MKVITKYVTVEAVKDKQVFDPVVSGPEQQARLYHAYKESEVKDNG